MALLALWILTDLAYPVKTDFRHFNPASVGRLETEMWRSYYERRYFQLFVQLARLMRVQFRTPFWRSYLMAYRAAKAAAVFQRGSNREEYALALPYLQQYFEMLNRMSARPFSPDKLARTELEWWIIRREPDQHSLEDWEQLLCMEASELYGLPADRFEEHAALRVQAMVLRDDKGAKVGEQDWQAIRHLLERSWGSMHHVLK